MEPTGRGGDGRQPDRFLRLLMLIMVLGLALRVAYVVTARDARVKGDGVYYHFTAGLIADGKGFITPDVYRASRHVVANASHPPAWPMLLSVPALLGLRTYLEQQLFASMVGAMTIVMVGLTGRRLAGVRAGLIAAVVAALYPYLWVYEREVLSETLVLLGTAVAILLALRFRARPGLGSAVAVGAACGVLTLARSEEVLLVGLLIAPLILLTPGASWRRRIGWFVAASIAVAVAIAPWAAYNATRFEEPVLLSTQLGAALRMSNCSRTYFGERIGFADRDCVPTPSNASARRPASTDESTRDLELRREALRYVRDHLTRVPIVVLAREGRTWGVLWPFQQMEIEANRGTSDRVRRLALLSYWLLVPAAVAGAIVLRRRRVTLVPIFAFVLTATTATALTFGYTRFRAPAEVPIVLLSAVAIDALLSSRRRHPTSAQHRDDTSVR